MSWHGRWDKSRPDPYAKPAKPGDVFGVWTVVRMAKTHPRYGLCALVRCCRCGFQRDYTLSQLRYKEPTRHQGCRGEVRAGGAA
jgi:hypothetical protein